jgi:hypothetical protein
VIKYRLGCPMGHEFDSWFASSAAFEDQARRKLIACPHCQSTAVDRAPMAPAVVSSRKNASAGRRAKAVEPAAATFDTAMLNELRQLKKKLTECSEYVGDGFADEARKIHYGEADERAIHGEATADEARALCEEDIPFTIVPNLPEDAN